MQDRNQRLAERPRTNRIFDYGFTTRPALMQAAQTVRRVTVPFTTQRTLCRFGMKRRDVMAVVCRPIPPLHLARPLRMMRLPTSGFLPQISQTLDMGLRTPYGKMSGHYTPYSGRKQGAFCGFYSKNAFFFQTSPIHPPFQPLHPSLSPQTPYEIASRHAPSPSTHHPPRSAHAPSSLLHAHTRTRAYAFRTDSSLVSVSPQNRLNLSPSIQPPSTPATPSLPLTPPRPLFTFFAPPQNTPYAARP